MTTSGERINYFAETDYRGRKIKFGIKEADRARHMYIIGKTGMGKSTLLENLAVQDIQNGEGVCFIDPHGSSADMLLSYVPEHRINDVVYFAPFDQEFPLALNVMEDIGADKRPLVASGLIGSFKKVWVDAWSPRMEYILNNALLALLEAPHSTLLGVNRMFADKAYREHVLTFVKDPSVLAFWKDEFAKYSDKFATEATAAIQNKVGQFAANPLIRNIVGQPESTFDIRKLMDEKKIFIVNLSKGRIGEGNAALIGSMLVTKIYLAAMSRAEVHATQLNKLPPFYLYVDEFQSFANESFADILSEARKYKLALTIAHQYIEQMSDEVRAAVFGNVGTMITFRVGSYDAEVLEKEFAPQFTAQDIVNLGFAQVYLKLMINNVGSQPFSATTLPRPQIPDRVYTREVIDASRKQFGKPREQVEADIRKWHEPVPGSEDINDVPKTKKVYPSDRPRGGSERPSGSAIAPRASRPPERGPSMDPAQLRAQIKDALQKSAVPPSAEAQTPSPSRPLATSDATIPERVVHQPFKEVLQAGDTQQKNETAFVPEIPPPVVSLKAVMPPSVQTSPVEQKNQATKPAYESRPVSLKNLTNKNKGPSQENLSSLKAALQAVVKKEEPLSTSVPTKPRETHASEISPQERIAPPAPKPVMSPPVSPQAKDAHLKDVLLHSEERESEKKTLPQPSIRQDQNPAQHDRAERPPQSATAFSAGVSQKEQTSAYPQHVVASPPVYQRNNETPEIPEDVLRKVLGLE